MPDNNYINIYKKRSVLISELYGTKMFITIVSFVFCTIFVCDCANILAIVPTPSFSHQIAFRQLWKELSVKGHNVTVVTTDPINDTKLKNLREINMTRSYEVWDQKYSFSNEASKLYNLIDLYYFMYDVITDVSDDQLSQPEMKDLIYGSEKYKFDAVMMEDFHGEFMAFGKIYNCPTIFLGTIGTTLHFHHYFGNNIHPVLHPDMNFPFAGELSFKERLMSTLFNLCQMYFDKFVFIPRKQQLIDRHFGNVTSVRYEDLVKELDFMMVNEIQLFKGIRSHGPTTVYVGGRNHMEEPKPLSPVNILLVCMLNY